MARDTAGALLEQDVRTALAVTRLRVLSFVAELSGNAFATVRQRVARHLLDLASERQRGPERPGHPVDGLLGPSPMASR
jgi:hypothetical protein